MEPEELEALIRERFKRYEEIIQKEARYEEEDADTNGSDIVVVSYGIASRICRTAVKMARERGVRAGYFRPVTLWPFPNKPLLECAKRTKRFLTVELNMGQMRDDVKLAVECSRPVDFYGRTGGMIPSPEEIADEIVRLAGNNK